MKSFRNETLKAVDDLVEIGRFASADEAVLAAIEAWHQTTDDPAERLEAIRLRVRRSIDDPRPSLSIDEVDAALDEMMAEAQSVPGHAAR
jgi:antitoxin ParD1/3/4